MHLVRDERNSFALAMEIVAASMVVGCSLSSGSPRVFIDEDQLRLPGVAESALRLQRLSIALARCSGDTAVSDRAIGSAGFRAYAMEAASEPSAACDGIVYIASSSMPLSVLGVSELQDAAADMGLPATVIDAAVLGSAALVHSAQRCVARDLVSIGATLHYPAAVVYRSGVFYRPILGFKGAAAYVNLIKMRLADQPIPTPTDSARAFLRAANGLPLSGRKCPNDFAAVDGIRNEPVDTALQHVREAIQKFTPREFEVPGRTGAYFRYVNGHSSIAYASNSSTYLLDLRTGEVVRGPGVVDLIPTPDGRLFVTPGEARSGLLFYDAAAVFALGREGDASSAKPVFRDENMRDQYPSVGVLSVEDTVKEVRVRYGVMTSWYDRVAFRDYIAILDRDHLLVL